MSWVYREKLRGWRDERDNLVTRIARSITGSRMLGGTGPPREREREREMGRERKRDQKTKEKSECNKQVIH